MTTNLRISLTILTIGFAIEGGGELYSVVSGGSFRPGVSLLFVFPVALTLAGLLFVWVGQHEWNALHRARVRRAHLVFGLSLLGALVAGTLFAALYLRPTLGTPEWARYLFGAAVGSLVLGTFVTYALLVFHLVPRPSQALLLASIAWAFVIATFVAAAMASDLPALLEIAAHRSLGVPSFVAPVDALASYLFLAYFLLLAAYVDAHRAILHVAPGGKPPAAPGAPGAGTPEPPQPQG
jgi:hypothetical protein